MRRLAFLLMVLGCTSGSTGPAADPVPVRLSMAATPSPASAGALLSPVVRVQVLDAAGAVVPTNAVSVTLSIASGTSGAILGGTLTRTTVGGVASFDDITLDRSGSFVLEATSSGLVPASTPSFAVAAAIMIVEGANHTGIAGYELGDAVAVRIEDPIGTPLDGVAVGWMASGGTLSHASSQTDANGIARVSWMAGAGAHTITASALSGSRGVPVTGLAPQPCQLTTANTAAAFPPRNLSRMLPTDRASRTAVLFIDFPDLPATRTVAEMLADIVVPAAEILANTTDGRLIVELVPMQNWLRMAENAEDLRWNDFVTHRDYIDLVLERVDPIFDFSDIDAVWIFRSSRYDPQIPSGVMTLPLGDFWRLPERDGRELHRFATMASDVHLIDVYPHWPNYGAHVVAHEAGHTYGLPDLYAYSYDPEDPWDGLRFTGGWSLMGWVAPATAWFAWERMYLDLLPASDAICPPSQPFAALMTVRPLVEPTGVRAVGLRTGIGTMTFLEVRQRLGLDAALCATGVLVYEVDVNIAGGAGPIRVREGHPSAPGLDEERCGNMWNAPYREGDVIELGSPNVTVDVLREHPDGAIDLRIVRR